MDKSAIVYEEVNGQEGETESINETWPTSKKLLFLVKTAYPVVITFLLGLASSFIVLFYANHLHTTSDKTVVFAGISMSNMFINVSFLSLLIGMTTSVETLCSQHNGAKNYIEVGVVLQRSICVIGVMVFPVLCIWYFVEDIFLYLGTDQAICSIMGKYISIRAYSMPMDVIVKSYEKYLIAIGVMNPGMYAQITMIVSITITGAFIVHFSYDYEYLAYAYVVSTYLSGFLLILSSFLYPAVQRTIQMPTVRAVHDLKEFYALALPGLCMLVAEWWAFEVLTVFASQLGAHQVSSQTIIMQIASLAFMVPLGISTAASSLVGNAIGAQKLSFAKELAKLSLILLCICEIFFVVPLILIGGPSFVMLFSSDQRVLTTCTQIVPVLALFTLGDGVQAVSSGIIRGAGKQSIGAVINIIAYYLFGIPLAWIFCFSLALRVNGLILGICVSPVLQSVVLVVIILYFDTYIFDKTVGSQQGDVEMEMVLSDITDEAEDDGETTTTIQEEIRLYDGDVA